MSVRSLNTCDVAVGANSSNEAYGLSLVEASTGLVVPVPFLVHSFYNTNIFTLASLLRKAQWSKNEGFVI